MNKNCEWCDSEQIQVVDGNVYWELPDGSRAIEITETPTVTCQECGMTYQAEKTVKEIEDQLFLVQTSSIDKQISFSELMAMPRLLKRNYFDFSS